MQTNTTFNWLFFLIWGVILFGIVMITSVSVFESYQIMVKIHGADYCQNTDNNCNGFYLYRHLRYVFVGMGVFLAGLLTPLFFWKRMAPLIFLGALSLLTILLATSIGGEWGTAKSWINIPFLPSIQPSEITKMALIFYLAIWMDKKERLIQTWSNGFMPFAILMIPPALLIAIQPDFGSLMVIALIAATMFFVAGGNILHIILGGIITLIGALPIILSHDYIKERFLVFLNPGSGDENAYYQVLQSLITAGSGKMFGLGLMESGQRHGFLPEAQSDTIFAIAAEELGFLRMIFLVGAFALIAVFGYQVAKNAGSRFEMLVASGITAWITFQSFINMAVTLGILPLTGITLPFISYGGSSLVSLLFASGVLLHIAKHSSSHASSSHRGRQRRAHIPRPVRR